MAGSAKEVKNIDMWKLCCDSNVGMTGILEYHISGGKASTWEGM